MIDEIQASESFVRTLQFTRSRSKPYLTTHHFLSKYAKSSSEKSFSSSVGAVLVDGTEKADMSETKELAAVNGCCGRSVGDEDMKAS